MRPYIHCEGCDIDNPCSIWPVGLRMTARPTGSNPAIASPALIATQTGSRRACDRCHTVKERCRWIHGQGECERCQRLHSPCQTRRPTKPSGRKPRHTLPKAAATALLILPHSKRRLPSLSERSDVMPADSIIVGLEPSKPVNNRTPAKEAPQTMQNGVHDHEQDAFKLAPDSLGPFDTRALRGRGIPWLFSSSEPSVNPPSD